MSPPSPYKNEIPSKTRREVHLTLCSVTILPSNPSQTSDFCRAGSELHGLWAVPGNNAGSPAAIAGDTVLFRKQPNAAAGDDTTDFTEQRYFRCLSANNLHYWGSLNVDPAGEASGPFHGWPSYLTVTPWYGNKKT